MISSFLTSSIPTLHSLTLFKFILLIPLDVSLRPSSSRLVVNVHYECLLVFIYLTRIQLTEDWCFKAGGVRYTFEFRRRGRVK